MDRTKFSLCQDLTMAMASSQSATAWDDHFDKVYTIAQMVMDRIFDGAVPTSKM